MDLGTYTGVGTTAFLLTECLGCLIEEDDKVGVKEVELEIEDVDRLRDIDLDFPYEDERAREETYSDEGEELRE